MKRSEMLEAIKKVWIDSTSWPSDDIVAEAILKEIEEAGMLPPLTIEKSVIPGMLDFNINKWEVEDEKK